LCNVLSMLVPKTTIRQVGQLAISRVSIHSHLQWFTLEHLVGDSKRSLRIWKWAGAACLLTAVILGIIPIMPGVRDDAGYAAMGEGFCYWDMAADGPAVVMLLLTLVLISVTVVLNCKSVRALHLQDEVDFKAEKYAVTAVLAMSYLLTWILWPVASILTLSDQSFPSGLMIAGGMLGHAQALVNPVLYGWAWRRYFLDGRTEVTVKEIGS